MIRVASCLIPEVIAVNKQLLGYWTQRQGRLAWYLAGQAANLAAAATFLELQSQKAGATQSTRFGNNGIRPRPLNA